MTEQKQTKNTPQKNRTHDPLLECLAFLTTHYGRARSSGALTAGLAYDGRSMRPQLFCEAADRIGLKSQIIKKADLESLDAAVLPVVLVLEGERAVVQISPDEIYDPETKTKKSTRIGYAKHQ
jgi:ATP-binding cassette subfamily C protein LapB